MKVFSKFKIELYAYLKNAKQILKAFSVRQKPGSSTSEHTSKSSSVDRDYSKTSQDGHPLRRPPL